MARTLSAEAHRSPRRRAIGLVLMVLGIAGIAAVTLDPTSSSESLAFWCLTCGERPGVDVLLNVVLFIPLGAGIGVYGLSLRRAVVAGILCTAFIELLQFVAVAGRHPAFRDMLSNAAGALIGYGLGRQWQSIIRPNARAAYLLCLAMGLLWATTQMFTSWAMALAPSPPPWWAQLKPHHGRYPATFVGDIAALSIGALAVAESDRITHAADARRQLIDGAPL